MLPWGNEPVAEFIGAVRPPLILIRSRWIGLRRSRGRFLDPLSRDDVGAVQLTFVEIDKTE